MTILKYAGIGSRRTPFSVLEQMIQMGAWMGKRQHILRSGAATGADQAFERGCDLSGGTKEIYLPWNKFGGSKSRFKQPTAAAMKMAAQFHPRWDDLSHAAKKLHARNCHQVLGYYLNDPVHFVLCWTPGGHLFGGTAQALRIAKKMDILVANIGSPHFNDQWKLIMDKYLKD